MSSCLGAPQPFGGAVFSLQRRYPSISFMTQIVFIGIAVLDHVFRVDALPTTAEKHRARDLTTVGGGLAANAAVAAARLGADAALATRLGDDLVAAEIIAGLEREGVDCASVRRFPGCRSPLSAVFVDKAGERMVVNYGDPAISDAVDWLPASLPPGTDAVMGDTRWEKGAIRLFEAAHVAGIPAVLDVDRRPADMDLLDAATHIALSVQGLREITGTDDPAAGLKALAERYPAWLAVTVGAQGTLFLENGELANEPAFRVEAVDTLAAGDVWHGAFTVALAEGKPEREAIRFAAAVAAIKCMRFGGREGAPGRAEVEAFLAERGAGK
jgi:sulfofructose kinase